MLLQDCPGPAREAATNADLLRLIERLDGALASCNLDKRALREWAEKVSP